MGKRANRSNGGPSTPMLAECPVDHIREIAKTIPSCVVAVKRRNAGGRVATITGFGAVPMNTLDLLEMDKFIEGAGLGGGNFEIEAKNPLGEEPYWVAKFRHNVEGSPLLPRAANSPMPFMAMPFGQMPPGAPPMPGAPMPGSMSGIAVPPVKGGPPPGAAWAQGLSPVDQAAYMESAMRQGYNPYGPFFPGYGYPQPQPPVPSDAAVALRELSDLKAMLGKLEAKLEDAHKRNDEMQREHSAKLDEMRRDFERREREMTERHAKELQAERDRRDEERRRAEEKEREAQRQEFERRLNETRENKSDRMTELLTKLVDGGSSKKSEEMSLQVELAKLNQSSNKEMMTMLVGMMNAGSKSEALVMEMLKQKSPQAQAEVLGNVLELMMTMNGAMVNMVQAMHGDDRPPWMQIAEKGLEAVQNIAHGIATQMNEGAEPVDAKVLPRRRPPAALPAPQQPAGDFKMETVDLAPPAQPASTQPQQAAQPAPAEVVEAESDEGEDEEEITPEAIAEASEEVLANPEREAVEAQIDGMAGLVPDDFRTEEWREILVQLHMQEPADQVAELIVSHLENLLRFKRLPKQLAGLTQKPAATLLSVFRWLPIHGKAPDYVREVIQHVVGYLIEDRFVQAPAEEQEQAQA